MHAMRRLQFIEIIDQAWCPGFIREGITDQLQFFLNLGHYYDRLVGRLQKAIECSGAERIIDLCSGGGGPWEADQNIFHGCCPDPFNQVTYRLTKQER